MISNKIDQFLVGLILFLALCGVDARAVENEDKPDEMLTMYTCYAKFTCYTQGNTTFRVPGTATTKAAAQAAATANAITSRNYCVGLGHSVSPVTDDPPCSSTSYAGPIAYVAASKDSASEEILVMYSCLTRNGNPKSQIAYGLRSDLDSMSELMWNRLAIDAAADGGMVPGTSRTRIEPMHMCFAFQTVQSKKAGNIHREFTLEGRGATMEDAMSALDNSTKKVIAHLASTGEAAQTVGSPREVTMLNHADDMPTESCVFRCETTYGPTVVATEYGFSKNEARVAARAIAERIATEFYGGVRTCVEIEPHQQP